MKKIHNLHALELERERLRTECRMKEMQLQKRLDGFGDALPDLVWLFLPRNSRTIWNLLRQLVHSFTGGPAADGESPEGNVFRAAFQLVKGLFSRKKDTDSTTEQP